VNKEEDLEMQSSLSCSISLRRPMLRSFGTITGPGVIGSLNLYFKLS